MLNIRAVLLRANISAAELKRGILKLCLAEKAYVEFWKTVYTKLFKKHFSRKNLECISAKKNAIFTLIKFILSYLLTGKAYLKICYVPSNLSCSRRKLLPGVGNTVYWI
jgi:transcription elongation factor GreA-like protein